MFVQMFSRGLWEELLVLLEGGGQKRARGRLFFWTGGINVVLHLLTGRRQWRRLMLSCK